MMSKNGGEVMPADSIRPCLDQRSDVGLGRLVLPYHGSCSECLLMCAPRTNARTRIRHAKQIFSCRAMPPGTAEISRDACGRKNAHASAVNQKAWVHCLQADEGSGAFYDLISSPADTRSPL